MSDDEPEGEPAVTVRGRRLGDHAIMNLELLAGLFGLGRTLLDNASEAVKTLLHSRFRIPFEALEWGTETVSADVLAAATGIGESELAQRVTAEALALADRVAITVQAFLEGKQLLGEVEVTHSGWHRGDDDVMREVKGTYKGKRVRVARFVDSAGNAKLETVTVDGEARELLAFDVLLAEFFAELLDLQVIPLDDGGHAVSGAYDAFVAEAMRSLQGRFHRYAAAWEVRHSKARILEALQRVAGVDPVYVFVHETPMHLEDLVGKPKSPIPISVSPASVV